MITPFIIELLLHFHTSPEPHPHQSSPAAEEAIRYLLGNQTIHPHPNNAGVYSTTELGEAWVALLCTTPPPRLVYVDQHGNKIVPASQYTEPSGG